MIRNKIRLDFCNFQPNFSKTDNFFYRLLSERFELELCDQPDFLIYSPYGHEHCLHSGIRIFYSGESDLPDFSECDYSVASIKLDDPRHLQLPLYILSEGAETIIKKRDNVEMIMASKTKFCAFVIGGYNPRKNHNRVAFFQKLSQRKRVDSAGTKFNNIGGGGPRNPRSKIEFLRPYKFNIAYENRSLPGYTTEKIFEPMVARCLPIYWGDPDIYEQFDPRSFLNRADFSSDEALIEKIIELDNDDAKYLEYMRQPYFYGDEPNLFFDRQRLLDFFEKIFTTKIMPVAQARRRTFSFGRLFGRWKLVKRHHWQPANPPTWQ